MAFELVYPDVLGSITGGIRIIGNGIQYALGVFPQQAFINQPLEVVMVVQSMLDQPMEVRVGLQMPTRDKKGKPVTIEVARPQVGFSLTPGEVGVLHVPFMATPPTPAGEGYPLRVVVRTSSIQTARYLRPPDGGPMPSVLGVSPFRLQVLQDVDFTRAQPGNAPDAFVLKFDLAANRLPDTAQDLKMRYEKLWSNEQVMEEIKLAQSQLDAARQIAFASAEGTTYWHFLEVVGERFAEAGMPLHPGEARAIAKIMAYTIDPVPIKNELRPPEQDETSRWFRQLAQVLAHDPTLVNVPRGDLITQYLFDAVLYDAILRAFEIVQERVHENLGNMEERVRYAERVLTWLITHHDPDLSYIYLPLAMAGLCISKLVMFSIKREGEWVLFDQLREAYQGRQRLVSGEMTVIFKMLEKLMSEVEMDMRQRNITR